MHYSFGEQHKPRGSWLIDLDASGLASTEWLPLAVPRRLVTISGTLDELLTEREKINKSIQEILDRQTDPWGIKVSLVEVKAIDLPEEMKRAMAKQAEAEREKRAKIIHAEGELMASYKILEAANLLSQNPVSLQLRYLQTLTEIATEKNSTIIFPLPMDIIKPFLKAMKTE